MRSEGGCASPPRSKATRLNSRTTFWSTSKKATSGPPYLWARMSKLPPSSTTWRAPSAIPRSTKRLK